MNKKILFLILSAVISVLPVSAYAALPACGTPGTLSTTLNTIMENITNVGLTVGSALAVIGFIVAGVMYLTAGGAPEKLGTAKKAVIAAVIGAGLVALAGGAHIMVDIFCHIIGA